MTKEIIENDPYKSAGVDIDAGNDLVDLIKEDVASSHNHNVLGNIGGFAGMFKLDKEYKNPILVACTDGVGTKVALAQESNKLDNIGQDLVGMCVNDLVVCGAKPLFFLDYFASSKLEVSEASRVIKRGTAVHDYIEQYYLQEDRVFSDWFVSSGLSKEPRKIKQPARDIIKECDRNNFTPYAQEIPLWHPKLKFAGRVVGIGLWNGVLSIIDFKTSKKKKYTSQIKNYYIQATAYAVAHNYLFNTAINNFSIVIGVDEKESQCFTGKVVNFIPELKYRVRSFYTQQKGIEY